MNLSRLRKPTLPRRVIRKIGRGLLAAGLAAGSFLIIEQNTGLFLQKPLGKILQACHHEETSLFKKCLKPLDFPPLEERIKTFYQTLPGGNITVFDSQNNIIAEYKNFSQKLARSEIPSTLFQIAEAAEDRRFRQHQGWDLGSAVAALANNLQKRISQADFYPRGASTIPIQLADLLLEDSPSWKTDKIREWLYATEIEQTYTKDEILRHFLNFSYFGYSRRQGQHLVGIGSAANYYFNKSVKELTPTEMIILVAMIKKPTAYGTLAYEEVVDQKKVDGPHFSHLLNRAEYVLENLRAQKTISSDLYYRAKRDFNYRKIWFYQNSSTLPELNEAAEYLSEVKKRLGHFSIQREKLPADLSVHTYFDLPLQRNIREVLIKSVKGIREKAKFSHPEFLNAAALVLDTRTQGVLALVGGLGVEEGDYLNRAVSGHYGPGSAFKPFVLATALLHDLTLEDKFFDAPQSFAVPNSKKTYSPRNFKGEWTHQEVSLYEAFIHSKNMVFVKLSEHLSDNFGHDVVRDFVNPLGFNIGYYGLSSALGANEVPLINLAGAYSIFTNGGWARRYPAGDVNFSFIDYLQSGNRLIRPSYQTWPVLDNRTYREMDRALRGVVAEGTGTPAELPGYYLRGKTGTGRSSFMFIGYEPIRSLLVAVAFASDQPDKTGDLGINYIGGSQPARAFREIMEYLTRHQISPYLKINHSSPDIKIGPLTDLREQGQAP